MKLHVKQSLVLGIGLAALTQVPLSAAETITLGLNGAQNFQNAISAEVYDRALGSLYVGVGDNGDQTFSLARLDRVNNFFTPLAPEGAVTNNKAVNALALTGDCRNGATHLVSVIEGNTDDERKVTLSKLEDNGATATQTSILDDADEDAAERVTHLAGSDKYVFARVRSENAGNGDGLDSAITLLELTGDTLTVRDTKRFDHTTSVVRRGTDDNLASLQVQALHWNEELKTLYIASRIEISNSNVNNVGYAVVKGRVESGNLVLSRITPATPVANDVFGGVFAWASGLGFEGQVTGATVNITHITTHKSSTGHWFITVAGGPVERTGFVENNPENILAGNVLHTFPLDPTTGCIVQNVLTNGSYQTPLANGFGQSTTSPSDESCRGKLPYEPDNNNPFVQAQHGVNDVYPWVGAVAPSDLVAVDDAIYTAYNGGTPVNANTGGVWRVEQAFGFDGASAGFPIEVKRAYPSAGNHDTDKTKFVEVDAKSGKVLRVGGNATSVERTEWQRRNFGANSLPAVINDAFCEGVFSVADFHGSLSTDESPLGGENPCDLIFGISGNAGIAPQHSYSLFGGCEKVLITHNSGPVDSENQYQVTQNYNFKSDDEAPFRHKKCTTRGLEGTGRVRALGFAEVTHTRLWFVAGTEKGLYVYGKENGDALTNDNTDDNPYGNLDDSSIFND